MQKQIESFLSISDFGSICLRNWKWFLASITFFVGMGVYYLMSTPKTYTQWVSILIKQESVGKSAGNESQEEFDKIGLVNQVTNVSNVLSHITSLDVLVDVGRKLNLSTEYYTDGILYDRTLYKVNNPIEVEIIDNGTGDDRIDDFSFHINLRRDGGIYIHSIVSDGVPVEKTVWGKCDGKPIKMPFGTIAVHRTDFFEKYKFEKPIKVFHCSDLAAAGRIKDKVMAERGDEQSTIFSLRCRDTSIRRAQDILNQIVVTYNEKWLQEKQKTAVNSSEFIDKRLTLIERELSEVDDSISAFKSQHGITDLSEVGGMYLQKYSQSDAELLELRNQMSIAQHMLETIKKGAKDGEYHSLPAHTGVGNQQTEQQIAEYNTLVKQLNSHSTYTSRQNPLIRSIERQLGDIRRSIINSVQNRIDALNIQLQSIEDYSGETTSKIESNPNQAKHLISVERQQKVKEGLYIYLLQKAEETNLVLSYAADILQMIDMPHGPTSPTAPIGKNVMMACLVIGFLLPAVSFFIIASLDNTVHTKEDVMLYLSAPIIGEIPYLEKKRKHFWNKKQKDRHPIVVKDGAHDVVNEAFRLIRSNLDFFSDKKGKRDSVIMVTSSYEGSGKTFVTQNLCVTLAIQGKKGLLIYGDLRHATSSYHWNNPHIGISSYLCGIEKDVNQVIYDDEQYEGLSYSPVGAIPPNPTELLSNGKLEDFLEAIKDRYDYVIIDTPPVENIADAILISKYIDQTLFVVRAGLCDKSRLATLEEYYTSNKLQHMSVILNCSIALASYKFRYGYHYFQYH